MVVIENDVIFTKSKNYFYISRKLSAVLILNIYSRTLSLPFYTYYILLVNIPF